MSWAKSDGALIKITFDKPLTGDVTGLVNPIAFGYQKITGTVTASSFYAGNPASNAIDDSLSTEWLVYPWSTGTWFKVQYATAKAFPKWRLYLKNSNYRPADATLQGSNDGSTWTDISVHTIAAQIGWQEFITNNTTLYLYYRLYMNACVGGECHVAEIQFCDKPTGNETHFTVTSKEYDRVPNGSIINVMKTVKSVSAGSTSKEVVLETLPLERFESTMELTVAYDGLGSLAGSTGNVESFSQVFVPQELAPKPDQNDVEHIEISGIALTSTLTCVYITSTAEQEQGHIEILGIALTSTLTHVNDI